MKEPKKIELTKKEFDLRGMNEQKIDKVFREIHYCPICNKKSVEYTIAKYSNGDETFLDIEKSVWHYVDDDSKFEVVFICSDDGTYLHDDELIFFDLKDFGVKIKETIFKDLFDEYEKKFGWQRKPYFCSNECCKKYMLSKILKK